MLFTSGMSPPRRSAPSGELFARRARRGHAIADDDQRFAHGRSKIRLNWIGSLTPLVPAKAGTQLSAPSLDSRLRGNKRRIGST